MKKWILLSFCIVSNSFAKKSSCPNHFEHLNPLQKQAIEEAHLEGFGEKGKNGALAGIENYTEAQLRRKAKILKKAGFSLPQRRTLMESGTVGVMMDVDLTTLSRRRMYQVEIESLSPEELRLLNVKKLSVEQLQQLDLWSLTNYQLHILSENYYHHLTAEQKRIYWKARYPGQVGNADDYRKRMQSLRQTEWPSPQTESPPPQTEPPSPQIKIKSFLTPDELKMLDMMTLSVEQLQQLDLRLLTNDQLDVLRDYYHHLTDIQQYEYDRIRQNRSSSSQSGTETPSIDITTLSRKKRVGLKSLTPDELKKLDMKTLSFEQLEQLNLWFLTNAQLDVLDKYYRHLTHHQQYEYQRIREKRSSSSQTGSSSSQSGTETPSIDITTLSPRVKKRSQVDIKNDVTPDELQMLDMKTLSFEQLEQLNLWLLTNAQLDVLDKYYRHLTHHQQNEYQRIRQKRPSSSQSEIETPSIDITTLSRKVKKRRQVDIKNDVTPDELKMLDMKTLSFKQLKQLNLWLLTNAQLDVLDNYYRHLTHHQQNEYQRIRQKRSSSSQSGIEMPSIDIATLGPRVKKRRQMNIKSLTPKKLRMMDMKTLSFKQLKQLDLRLLTNEQLDALKNYYRHLTDPQQREYKRIRGL